MVSVWFIYKFTKGHGGNTKDNHVNHNGITDAHDATTVWYSSYNCLWCNDYHDTVKILKFGTPQTIAIIVLNIEKFDVALH